MATTYQWTFPALEAYPEHAGATDVVFTVHYRLDGIDDEGRTAGVYGTVGVSYEEGEPFTPFAELTEAQVTAWVEDALGEDQIAAAHANIDSQLADLANPQKVTLAPPWAQVVAPAAPEVVPAA